MTMMFSPRVLLLPIAAAVELVLFGICLVAALIHPRTAKRLADLRHHLPGLAWYLNHQDQPSENSNT